MTLRRVPLLVWIVAPVLLAALIAWPLGGWDTVTLVSRTLPQFASNQTLHGHRFDIRIDDAWVSDVHPAYGAADPDDHEQYLIVTATVTNTTRDVATSSDLREYIAPQVPGVDLTGFGSLDYVLAADASTLPELNPGLPRDLELVYTVPAGTVKPGDDLRIDLSDALSRQSFLSYGLFWDYFPAGYAIRNVGQR